MTTAAPDTTQQPTETQNKSAPVHSDERLNLLKNLAKARERLDRAIGARDGLLLRTTRASAQRAVDAAEQAEAEARAALTDFEDIHFPDYSIGRLLRAHCLDNLEGSLLPLAEAWAGAVRRYRALPKNATAADRGDASDAVELAIVVMLQSIARHLGLDVELPSSDQYVLEPTDRVEPQPDVEPQLVVDVDGSAPSAVTVPL